MKVLNPLLLLFACISAQAQTDSLLQIQQEQMNALKQTVQSIQQNNDDLQRKNEMLNASFSAQQTELKTVKESVAQNTANIKTTADELGVKIDQTNATAQTNQTAVQQSLKAKTLWGLVAFIIALLTAGIIYLLLHKRISSSVSAIDKIKESQRALQEESVKLDGKMVELLDGQMKLQKAQLVSAAATEPDHSLALKVADEIVIIETNLSRMDSSVKGYKQLSASLRRIKDNFLANGYEVVDMLGKSYNEGMKAEVTFVTDENLKDGEQIITRITKPHVNYDGVMIQAAQIEVSQNE